MEVVRKVLEFDVVTEKSEARHNITKRNWGSTRDEVEAQLNKISNTVWDGACKDEIAGAIAKTIYTLTLMACDAGIEDRVKEYLRAEHRE